MAVSIPVKLQSLRESSMFRRLEAERRRSLPRQRDKQRSKPKLSKYRRKCANAKERERMSKVNEMFDKLKTIVPEGLATEKEDKETKVTTLRSAITYITELQQLLTDYDAGYVDPTRYQDTRATKENRNRANGKVTKRPQQNNKTKTKILKRKRALKPKRSDYPKSNTVKCDTRPVPVNLQPAVNVQQTVNLSPNSCDTVGQDYIVYRTDIDPSQIEYVVYDNGHVVQQDQGQVLGLNQGQSHVLAVQQDQGQVHRVQQDQEQVLRLQQDQVLVYEEDNRGQELNPEELPKDYVLYREDSEAGSPKDVNVISLYISLIDGKRLNADV